MKSLILTCSLMFSVGVFANCDTEFRRDLRAFNKESQSNSKLRKVILNESESTLTYEVHGSFHSGYVIDWLIYDLNQCVLLKIENQYSE